MPIKRCWDFVSDYQKAVAQKVFDGMKEAGAEMFHVDYPSAEDRIAPSLSFRNSINGEANC